MPYLGEMIQFDLYHLQLVWNHQLVYIDANICKGCEQNKHSKTHLEPKRICTQSCNQGHWMAWKNTWQHEGFCFYHRFRAKSQPQNYQWLQSSLLEPQYFCCDSSCVLRWIQTVLLDFTKWPQDSTRQGEILSPAPLGGIQSSDLRPWRLVQILFVVHCMSIAVTEMWPLLNTSWGAMVLAASCDTFGFSLGFISGLPYGFAFFPNASWICMPLCASANPLSFESYIIIHLLNDSPFFFGRTCSTVLLGDPSMSSFVERPSLFSWMLHWICTEEHHELVFAACGRAVPWTRHVCWQSLEDIEMPK